MEADTWKQVCAQAFALASKSERVAYSVVSRHNDGLIPLNRLLNQGQFRELPTELTSIQHILAYLVSLENLKLTSIQTKVAPKEASHMEVGTIAKFAVLYKALGIVPEGCRTLRDLGQESGGVEWGKMQEMGVQEAVERLMQPVVEMIAGKDLLEDLYGVRMDNLKEFVQKVDRELTDTKLVSRQDAEHELHRCQQLCVSIQTSLPAAPLDFLPLSQSPSPDAVTTLAFQVHSALADIRKRVSELVKSCNEGSITVATLKSTNEMLKNILKQREQDLETLGEEYYSFATQNTVMTNEQRRKYRGSTLSRSESESISDLKSPATGRLTVLSSFPEEDDLHTDETVTRTPPSQLPCSFDRLEKLALSLHRDCDRQTECYQSVFKMWVFFVRSQRLVSDMTTSNLRNVSLEGKYKAKVLSENPIKTLIAGNRLKLGDLMPSYELFPVLYQIFDAISLENSSESSFPVALMEHLSICLPVQVKVHQFLGTLLLSLQPYTYENLAYAVFFSRLMHVFHPDPLLTPLTCALYRLNNYLLALEKACNHKALRVRMADDEAGGNIFLYNALELAFRLPFSADLRLFSHFLTCIKPVELTNLQWSAFIIGAKADFLLLDLSAIHVENSDEFLDFLHNSLNLEAVKSLLEGEILLPEALNSLLNPQIYSDIKTFLCIPRGYLLDSLLQIYDLFVDGLFTLLAVVVSGRWVEKRDYYAFLERIQPGLRDEEREEQWKIAQAVGNEGVEGVTKDAAHLSVVVSQLPQLAVKPLHLPDSEVRVPHGHSRTISFEYRSGRLALQDSRTGNYRRNLSQLQSRYGNLRRVRTFVGSSKD